ncbi:MAG: hypothetical protein QF632_00955 [Candidatus Woesearchaeota archaeon]|jgi:hypothetical protein|nr:hypothetical protein [Candidatus Woesearchaeota archaeon]MDP7323310.1 hypothetical protein [Candidatus Woesearchaeota archaeon]MDP7457823.1 hypothetical protein [Candidatus Woesearchaeota archaeon]
MEKMKRNCWEKFESMWKNFRIFAYRNRSAFELIFILIYTIEQVCLVLLTYYFPQFLFLVISNYSILLLSTFAIHKIVMESRINILERNLNHIENKFQNLISWLKIVAQAKTNIPISKILNTMKGS